MLIRTSPVLALALAFAPAAHADVTLYTSQLSYLQALQSLGHTILREDFENDAVWGDVRSTIVGGFHTAPSVTSQGLTWSSNFAGGEITTGDGAARRGTWGFYAYPHGSYATGADCTLPGACGDGFVGTSANGMFAMGGWIQTNTPPADLNLFLDGVRFDFGAAGQLDTSYAFFGAISDAPFRRFEFREMEGSGDEAKYIFADDFFFALSPVPEPSTYALMLAGLGLVGWAARRGRD